MTVTVRGLKKSYGLAGGRSVEALRGIDLEVRPEELLVVVGPSGSGKTTLLRCIAGLEAPDEGTVAIAGRPVDRIAPGDRDVAMVFQEHALFPHMTVRENITFGMRARKVPDLQIGTTLNAVAPTLGLEGVLDRHPADLSGGERQRVALARAMVREPAAWLMDEPLSNLDAELRVQMRSEIRSLQRRVGTTTIYVTHDQAEAMTLGDRVAVLRDGRLEQIDAPMALYTRPANAFVARFLGSPPMNLFPSTLHATAAPGTVLGLRPERIRLVEPGEGRLAGRIEAVEPVGASTIVHVDVDGHRFLVVTWDGAPEPGRGVGLAFDEADLHRFTGPEGGRVG